MSLYATDCYSSGTGVTSFFLYGASNETPEPTVSEVDVYLGTSGTVVPSKYRRITGKLTFESFNGQLSAGITINGNGFHVANISQGGSATNGYYEIFANGNYMISYVNNSHTFHNCSLSGDLTISCYIGNGGSAGMTIYGTA